MVYGQYSFKKKFGERNQWCYACKNTKMDYVRTALWFHFLFIPLFPVGFVYSKICPSCGNKINIPKKQFFEELAMSDELPPTPFSERPIEAASGGGTREITVIREKKLYGAAVKAQCLVDGNVAAVVKNGKTVKFSVDNEERNLFVTMGTADGKVMSNVVKIERGGKDKTYRLTSSGGVLQLSAEHNAAD
jgi:hypothetical protein